MDTNFIRSNKPLRKYSVGYLKDKTCQKNRIQSTKLKLLLIENFYSNSDWMLQNFVVSARKTCKFFSYIL